MSVEAVHVIYKCKAVFLTPVSLLVAVLPLYIEVTTWTKKTNPFNFLVENELDLDSEISVSYLIM